MPLFHIPVVVPYRLTDDRSEAVYPVQVAAAATTPAAALATATVLVESLTRLRHPGQDVQVLSNRAQVGKPLQALEGPYAYVLTRGHCIPLQPLPARIDEQTSETLGLILSAFDDRDTLGVIVDCAPLTAITSAGLTTLSRHARNLHLFRLPAQIAKVFTIVGLDDIIHVEPTLQACLDTLVQQHFQRSRTTVTIRAIR
jgi:anti-anti-sigma regulatory factor